MRRIDWPPAGWSAVSLAFTPVLGLAVLACGSPGAAPTAAPEGSTTVASSATLAVTDRSSENIALASDGSIVVAAWSATDAQSVEDVFAAVSGDGGKTFSSPVRVNATSGEARVNGEQPPRPIIRTGADGAQEIDVFWTVSTGGRTRFAAARSRDGGLTFQALELPVNVNAQGQRGWAAFRPSGSGQIDAVWLDHRRLAPPPGTTSVPHDHRTHAAGAEMDSVAMAQLSDLYFASFTMPGSDLAMTSAPAARAISSGVCYCCKTAMAHGAVGTVYLAWRHVYPGDMRDIAFVASRDGGRTFSAPVRVHEDGWAIKGCPDDGPAMVADRRGRVHIVWPTMIAGTETATKTILYSSSSDGRSFLEPVALPARGHAHHPQVTVTPDGRVVVLWDEASGDSRSVVMAVGRADADGRTDFVRAPDLDSAGVYPTLIDQGDAVLVGWVSKRAGEKSVIRVQRIVPGT